MFVFMIIREIGVSEAAITCCARSHSKKVAKCLLQYMKYMKNKYCGLAAMSKTVVNSIIACRIVIWKSLNNILLTPPVF